METYLAARSERKAHNREGTIRPATVAQHYRSLQQLLRWHVDDGETDRSPLERMRPPSVPEQPVRIVTDAHLEALLATWKGNTFENRRDSAMQVDDLDREESTAYVLWPRVGVIGPVLTGPRPQTSYVATFVPAGPT